MVTHRRKKGGVMGPWKVGCNTKLQRIVSAAKKQQFDVVSQIADQLLVSCKDAQGKSTAAVFEPDNVMAACAAIKQWAKHGDREGLKGAVRWLQNEVHTLFERLGGSVAEHPIAIT
jgi:hypothetical protein